jgi:hypothetical protein
MAVYDPVLSEGSSFRVNVRPTALGLLALHGPPPPVQPEGGSVTTLVAELVLATVDELQEVPNPAAPQV